MQPRSVAECAIWDWCMSIGHPIRDARSKLYIKGLKLKLRAYDNAAKALGMANKHKTTPTS